MKKVIFIVLVLCYSLFLGCSTETSNKEKDIEKKSSTTIDVDNHVLDTTNSVKKSSNTIINGNNFDFKIGFDVDAKNVIDTFNDTFTKDLVPGSAITNLVFTEEEMKSIYEEMKKIDILTYSDTFDPEGNIRITPYCTYNIKVQIDGRIKEIYWKDENISEVPEAIALRNLIVHIRDIIYSKDEYKKMPEVNGGYI